MIGKNRSRCFLDVDIENEHVGRIIIELFDDICPITCENFRFLCTGEKGFGPTTKKPLHYKNTLFHRVVKNFVIQGGDFVHGDGRGGESIYGGHFKDENFHVLHDQPFLLSMANRGKDSNGSQFFITTQAAPHLDGLHTVFGKVVSGKEVVSLIEDIETDSSNRPLKDVKISNCGEMVLQIKQKEKKKRREYVTESSGSESDSDESHKKKKKKKKHSKKHRKEKKDRKTQDSSAGRDEEDLACGVDPEEIPSIPTNKFLLRNTSPLPEGSRRNNIPRERDSYSFNRRPSRSKSGRKIKGRGFMRYRTPSPEGSRSGSETPPHWKQEQSRLRKMPEVIATKEQVSEDSQSQHEEMDEEMAIRNSMFQSRLGLIPKQTEVSRENRVRKHSDAMENRRNKEWSNDEYRYLKEQKHMMFKQSLTESEDRQNEKKFQNRDTYYNDALHSSPLRSKIVKSREYEDRFSDRRQTRDDRRYQTVFATEKKNSESQFEQKHDYSYDRMNKNALQKTGKENDSKKGSEQSVKSLKNLKALRSDLLRYVDADVDSEENETEKKPEKKIEDKIEKKNVELKKSVELKKNFKSLKSDLLRYVVFDPNRNDTMKKKKTEITNLELGKKDATTPLDKEKDVSNSVDKEQEIETPSLAQTTNESPKFDTNNSSTLLFKKNNELEAHSPQLLSKNENNIEDKFNMHTNSKNETFNDNKKVDAVDVEVICIPSDSEDLNSTSSSFVQESARSKCIDLENLVNSSGQHSPLKLLDCSKEVTSDSCKITNAPFDTIISESDTLLTKNQSKSPIGLTDGIPSNETAPIEGPSIWTREEEKNSDNDKVQPMEVETTDEKLDGERPISPQQRKSPRPQTPPTPDLSVKHRKKSPNRKYDRSSRSSSNSPVKRRRISKSPVERIASSSKRRRSSIDRRSKSPVHKYRSTSAQRTNRSTARNSKSRSRSRSGSVSPRDRRRRKSRSPVTRVRRSRSRSRPRNERGSQFYRYQSFRNRSPDRRGAYRRQYNKSPSYRGRRGGAHRSRSRSPARRRRGQRRSSSSSSSSSSRNSSSSDNNKSKKSHRDRKKQRSSSSSSSSKNSRSDSDSD